MPLLDDLLSRIHPGAKAEREMISGALAIVAAVKEKADTIRADGRLSKAGVQAKLVEIALGDPWSNLQQLRDRAKAATADISTRRAYMLPKRPDASDVATALLNSELRQTLKTATRADRLRLARDNDEFAAAALTAPLILSGLSDQPDAPGQPSDADIVMTAFQQRNHTELFAGLELRQEAADAVDAALEHATREICAEAGIVESDIGRLTLKDDPTEVDPDNLPKITRADLKALSATDPSLAAAKMKTVFEGKAQLVD
jgi:hypothetical protein